MDDKLSETQDFRQGADAKRLVGAVQPGAAPADQESWAAGRNNKSAILVVGMHRSGTSALARMLNLLGCDLPKTLLPGGPGNEPGHWESWPILALNEEILATAGSAWDDWDAFNPAWFDSPIKDGFLERALKTLDDEFGASRFFVLKDPRLCRILPFWIKALEAFGATPYIVCPVRHPIDVAASLEKRNAIDPSVGQLLWLRHVLDAEGLSRGLRRTFLRYEALLAGWRSLPDRLAGDLGIAWPRRSCAVDSEIDGFLSPAHRHHAAADANVLGNSRLSSWIRSCFEIFDRWARGEVKNSDLGELDRIRVAFSEAAPAFARAIMIGRQAARRSVALEAELAAAHNHSAGLVSAIAAKEAELAQRNATLTESRGRIDELETTIAAKDAVLAQRDATLAESRGRIDELKGAIAAKDSELAQRDAALTESLGRIDELKGAMAAKDSELAQRDAALTESLGRIDELKGAMAAKEAELGALHDAGAAREAHLGALQTTVAALRGSTSWRVTAPLRRAGLRLRRARYSAAGFPVTLGLRALMTWSRAPLRDVRAARAIRRSELFDSDWYLKNYPDVAAFGIDPVRHYVAFGAREGRDPGPKFSTSGYLRLYQDVAMSAVNPLWHCIHFGAQKAEVVMRSTLSHKEGPQAQPVNNFSLPSLTPEPVPQPSILTHVAVIVPVFNGYEFLEPLFASIERNTTAPYDLIVIDDASTDLRVWPYLRERMRSFSSVRLIRNTENKGFTATANIGIRLTESNFVIVNTDIEVPPLWLERLFAPLIEDPNVASVTPFTNSGTICSFPVFDKDNTLYGGWTPLEIDTVFARVSNPPRFEIPTGVGFCMAMSHKAVKEIGEFDDRTFFRGYGEENDWCMRASAKGYKHLLASNLFVFHKHGGSFIGADRNALREANYRKLIALHPNYDKIIRQYIANDPVGHYRRTMAVLVACLLSDAGVLLIIDHDLGGGANAYRSELLQEVARAGKPAFLYTENVSGEGQLSFFFGKLAFSFPTHLSGALRILSDAGIQLHIFFNNIVSYNSPMQTVSLLTEFCRKQDVHLSVTIHDYYVICPSYTLLNAAKVFCGLPESLGECAHCLPNCSLEHAADVYYGISRWRSQWRELLERSDEILCFSKSSIALMARAFPTVSGKLRLKPHSMAYVDVRSATIRRRSDFHVGIVGSINHAKGSEIVCAVARAALKQGLAMKFTVIGIMQAEDIPANLRVTGPYKRHELPDILEAEMVDICFFPSIWPETFSYVTHELIRLNIPVCCFDLGAQAEAVREYRRGRVLRSFDPASVLTELKEFKSMLDRDFLDSACCQQTSCC